MQPMKKQSAARRPYCPSGFLPPAQTDFFFFCITPTTVSVIPATTTSWFHACDPRRNKLLRHNHVPSTITGGSPRSRSPLGKRNRPPAARIQVLQHPSARRSFPLDLQFPCMLFARRPLDCCPCRSFPKFSVCCTYRRRPAKTATTCGQIAGSPVQSSYVSLPCAWSISVVGLTRETPERNRKHETTHSTPTPAQKLAMFVVQPIDHRRDHDHRHHPDHNPQDRQPRFAACFVRSVIQSHLYRFRV